MKKLFCLLACLLLALCCCGAVAEEACEHLNTNWDVGFQYDADGHWTICADCGEKNPYENCGPHEAVCWLDTCLVCGAPCTSDTVAHYNGGAVQYITDATSHWYVCSKCGVTTDPEAHWIGCWNADNTHCLTCGAECEPNHNWEVTNETEATCTTDGVTEYTCSSCDETKTETTTALGHEWEVQSEYLSTCTNCGAECQHYNVDYDNIQYDEDGHWMFCVDCGAISPFDQGPHENCCTSPNNCWRCDYPYSGGDKTDMWYHDVASADYYGEFLANETGHWFICRACGETVAPEKHYNYCDMGETTCRLCGYECGPIHDEGWKVTSTTEATCTTDGVTEYVCRYCGETKTETTTPALGHNYEYVYEPGPSCDVPGVVGEICSNCGDALWSEDLYHGNYTGQYTGYDETHHWGDCPDCGERMMEEAHENNCQSPDNCWLCGAPYSSGKLQHLRYGSNPYITDENGHWYVCSLCGVTTDPEPHWIGCWNPDNTHCLYCGVQCEPSHNWEVTSTTEATCTTDGVIEYTCSSCDETKTETTPATGHVMNDPVVVDPTCTEDGTSTATCATCGEEVVETLPATGHSFEDGGKTEPTCTEEGYQRGVCITCGETLDEPIPATGHTWEETERLDATCETDGYVIYTCSACGETKEETLYRTGHNWAILTVKKQPTCTERGLEYRHCSSCGWDGNTTLAPLGHDMVAQDNGDQVCSRCGYLEAAPVVEEPAEEPAVEPVEEPVEEPVTEIVIGESEPVAVVPVTAVIETQPDAEPVSDTITLMVYEPVETVAELLPETIQENVETVYVVELLDDGVAIEPSGILRLKIQLAEGADLTGQVLMLVAEDGTMIEIAYEVIDGCIVFETEHIGVFVLVNAAE